MNTYEVTYQDRKKVTHVDRVEAVTAIVVDNEHLSLTGPELEAVYHKDAWLKVRRINSGPKNSFLDYIIRNGEESP